MTNVVKTHREAMAWAEKGQGLLDRGDQPAAQAAFRRGMELEREAAYATSDTAEPDRSVLFRSAGSLALECEEFRIAEQLLAMGLAGNAPEEIADEMRDLLEQVHFRRHLDLRGLTLEANEVQMSISGSAVGYGIAGSDEFMGRVRDFEALVFRTAERKRGYSYREGGRPRQTVKDNFGFYLSVPRAASFAVTVRLGHPKEQIDFVTDNERFGVIDEVLDLLEVVQSQDSAELARRIPEEAYFRNFSALAKKLAPDGRNVTLVGLTSRRPDRSREVALTRPREELRGLAVGIDTARSEVASSMEQEPVEVRGFLHYADKIGGSDGTIKLEGPGGSVHEILVPEGLMTDIVRPLWDSAVRVTGVRHGRRIELKEIEPEEDQ